MNDKLFHLIFIVVGGVILADLVAHVAGTSVILSGIGNLFAIGTQPTNTSNIKTIKTTSVTNDNSKKV